MPLMIQYFTNLVLLLSGLWLYQKKAKDQDYMFYSVQSIVSKLLFIFHLEGYTFFSSTGTTFDQWWYVCVCVCAHVRTVYVAASSHVHLV